MSSARLAPEPIARGHAWARLAAPGPFDDDDDEDGDSWSRGGDDDEDEDEDDVYGDDDDQDASGRRANPDGTPSPMVESPLLRP